MTAPIPLFSLLLLAAIGPAQTIDQTDVIPAHDWRYHELPPDAALAWIRASFAVESGPPVRLFFLRKSDAERWASGEPNHALRITPLELRGALAMRPGNPTDYAVAIENPDPARAAAVHLRVTVDPGNPLQLPRTRQLEVIAIGFAVFFGLVAFSAARLLRAAKR